MTCVTYNIEPSETLQYLKFGTISKVIPILTRRRIDGDVAVVYFQFNSKSALNKLV